MNWLNGALENGWTQTLALLLIWAVVGVGICFIATFIVYYSEIKKDLENFERSKSIYRELIMLISLFWPITLPFAVMALFFAWVGTPLINLYRRTENYIEEMAKRRFYEKEIEETEYVGGYRGKK